MNTDKKPDEVGICPPIGDCLRESWVSDQCEEGDEEIFAAGPGLLRSSAALKADDFKRRFSVITHRSDHTHATQKLGIIPAVQSLRRVVSAFEIEVDVILS